MKRNPNGRSSIYQSADGYWHGRVTMGVKDDGTPDRRHVERKSKAAVVARVKELEKERDEGVVTKPGKRWTLEEWLVHWLENIARPHLRHTSYSAYRVAVYTHLIPGLGAHKLQKLEPEHLEKFYRRMTASGSKPATAHQAHRTVRVALGEALRRGHLKANPAAIAKPPRITDEDVEPYSVEESQRIMTEAGKQPNGARWAVALSLGLRQGEALALRWTDVKLEAHELRVRWTRLRPVYDHGCGGKCGRPGAGYCPERVQTNPLIGETKSRAGKRTIGLPDELVEILRRHRAEQDEARRVARQMWTEGGWVFATPTGEPLNPNTDYHDWKALLKRAEVREMRLHDARHTAATMLLALGVTERAAMGIMGWSSTAMAARYQHMTDPIRRDIAKRVGGLLWATGEGEIRSENEDPDDGAAGVLATA
ncbi:site-specific integrase [Kribbella sp. NPDC051770]|uniref:tyrosine-type recombinase/integrase n=1 Tax=Kribbella sp. NPDC051770 TaxID=3155413 RepID=UPI00342E52FE